MGLLFIFIFILPSLFCTCTYGYDSLDPNGNITIKWDILQWNSDNYDVKVSMFNFQLFRHIENNPGWRLNWIWQSGEVIWSMLGSEATEQGNCSKFVGMAPPHCCEQRPVIVDLLPGAPYNMQTANCCKGGVLSSMLQDDSNYMASFSMNVGLISNVNSTSNSSTSNTTASSTSYVMPNNFSVGLPGYSCGAPFSVPPSKFTTDGGRRWTQARGTWNVTCTYSEYWASPVPTCCVSLSAFYNETIVPCPKCTCACQHESNSTINPTQHMCPIRVHWHVKVSYREYWRVKMTVTNLNLYKNYSDWNVVVRHPNLKHIQEVFSFNYKPLGQDGIMNDSGIFYGLKYYNQVLLQSGLLESGQAGNLQTEILLDKDGGNFTFRDGWAFPRKISFNGHECVMPPPDQYPALPSTGGTAPAPCCFIGLVILSLLLLLVG